MFMILLRKYRNIMFASIFFFYLGCAITLSLLSFECVDTSDRGVSDSEYAVLVISEPDNEAKRDAIRATWAKFASNIYMENDEIVYKWNNTWMGQETRPELIKFFFAVGTLGVPKETMRKLTRENNRYFDLLLLDELEDTYKNLALKLLGSLEWISRNLRNLKYLIKCDDDSFVRVDLIVRDLENYAPEMNAPELSDFVSYKRTLPSYKGLYWGYFNGRARVYLSGKWQEQDWFLCDNYLPYALGGGYVISRNIVKYIHSNAKFLSCYKAEDVSMGVWTAPLDGINRVHDIRFDTEWKSRGCSKNMLIRHKQSPSDMYQLYRNLMHSNGERLCKTESAVRKSYIYDWDVLPSGCCK